MCPGRLQCDHKLWPGKITFYTNFGVEWEVPNTCDQQWHNCQTTLLQK